MATFPQRTPALEATTVHEIVGAPTEPPPLTAHMRDALIRGHAAALRRYEAMLAQRTHTTARTHTLRAEVARLEADLADLRGLA
jgi:hypothetical protein